MRPGTSRLLSILVAILVAVLIGLLLFGKGCNGCSSLPAVVPVVAPTSTSSSGGATTPAVAMAPAVTTVPAVAAPPSGSGASPTVLTSANSDSGLATPKDFIDKGFCGPLAGGKTFFVSDATGTEQLSIGFLCGQTGDTFTLLPTSKARIVGGNLTVSNGQPIEAISGNSMAFLGTLQKSGVPFGAKHLNEVMAGKTHLKVRVESQIFDMINPYIVITADNGGDTFDVLCAKYMAMEKAPASAWEAEIWSRCQRPKTASNVANAITIIKYVQANPGVTRDDFNIATSKIAVLEEKVTAAGNKVIIVPPQVVDTGVGKK